MGCDIHFYTEVFKNDNWVTADDWHPVMKWVLKERYNGRNYVLFGVLAGVRKDDVPRLSNPRGLPDDVCPQVADAYENMKDDAHSASFFTLEELLAFNWDQEAKAYGITEKLSEHCSDFVENTIPMLKLLGAPENVRIVFWFDN